MEEGDSGRDEGGAPSKNAAPSAATFLDREIFCCDGIGHRNCSRGNPNLSDEIPTTLTYMSQELFLERYWQRQPFHFPRQPEAYGDVFTVDDVEELWSNAMRYATNNTDDDSNSLLIFSGPGRQCGAVLRNPFFAFAHRCSVIVNRAERFSAALMRLCHGVEDSFPFAFVNVYVTPPGSQSVPRHSDDREVLLLQVFGEKEWTVYNSPVHLPYKHEEVGKRDPIDDSELSVKLKCTVKQGDILYLPRGAVHEGRTASSSTGASSSIHLTVALQSSDWDLNTMLLEAVKSFVRRGPAEGRTCLPQEYLSVPRCDHTHGGGASAKLPTHAVLEKDFASLQSLFVGSIEASLSQAVHKFHERIRHMRLDRINECSGSGGGVGGTLVRLPLPIMTRSLIMWNTTVDLDEIVENHQIDSVLPQLTYVVHCSRRRRHGQGNEEDEGVTNRDRMTFAASGETVRVVQLLYARHRVSPVEVRFLGLFDELANLAMAKVLIGNTSCVRVT